MGIEGRLQEVGLADICQLLAMGRKTGCLSVTNRSNFGFIYFDRGLVAHATVLNRRERLGEFLVAHGVVDRTALDRARQSAAGRPGVHYVHLLVEEGAVAPEELERFHRTEVEEAVYYLFTWEEGSFRFAPGRAPDEAVPTLVAIPAENLLLEGARRADEWTQIGQVVRSLHQRFVLAADPRENGEDPRTPEQAEVLRHLAEASSVAELVRAAGMVEFDAARAIYEMVGEGWLEPEPGGEGETAADEVSEEEPSDPLALGTAFYEAGMLEDAERELRSVLEVEPGSAEALDRLALIALRTGRARDALDFLDRAGGSAPPTYVRHRNRALALERLGRLQEALGELEAAGPLSGGDPDLHLARGVALLKSRRAREASAEFGTYRAAVEEGSEPPPLYYAYALLAAAMAGRTEDALRLGREGLERHPWSGPLLVNLGAVLERVGEPAAAEALYLRAVGEARTPPQAHRNLGDLALRRGDQAGARGHYERAVRLDPELGDSVLLRLGNLLYEEGDHDAARRHWSRALELNPENEVARTNLGLVASGS